MATLALGIAGGALGGPVGQAVGAALGSYIDNNFIFPALFPQDPVEGPRIGELRIGSSTEGSPLVRMIGAENRVAGNVIWLSKLYETATTEEVGGKGGPGIEQTSYSYSVDVAVSLGEAPPDGLGIVELTELIVNTKTLYQEHPDKTATATTLTAVANTLYRTVPLMGDSTPEQIGIVDFYTLAVASPIGGPDMSVFKSGHDALVSGFTETQNNGTWRVINSVLNSDGSSYVVFRAETVPFIDDTNVSAETITVFQALPQFNPEKVQSVTVYKGTNSQTADPTMSAIETLVPAYRGEVYVVLKGLQLADFGNQLPTFNGIVWASGVTRFDGGDPETVGGALQKILAWAKQDESRFRGLSALSFDTAAVDAIPLRGYAIRGAQSIRSVIQPIQLAYDLAAQEENGVISFFRRANAPTVAIDPVDLAAHASGSDAPRAFRTFDRQAQSLPKEVSCVYIDPEKRLQQGAQSARRLAVATGNVVKLELPLVLTAVQAKDAAERVLWTQHANRRGIELSLPPSYWTIQENDVLTWTDPDTSKAWRVLVQVVDRGANNLVRVEGTEEVAALLNFTSVADDPKPTTGDGSPYSAPELLLRIIDTAALRTEDVETPGIYVAVSTTRAADLWPAATLLASADDVVFAPDRAIRDETKQGVATTALGDVVHVWTWDRANTVRVDLGLGATLSSVTESDALAGFNRILIGAEVIGFAVATLVSDGVYDLTDLLRGLQGTEELTAVHTAGEEAIFLTARGVVFVPLALTAYLVERFYKAVPNSGTDSDFESVATTPLLSSVRPLAVAYLEGVRDGVTDWDLSWSLRTRAFIDPLVSDVTPLLEESEAYEIDILNVGTGAVVNTYTSGTPDFTYTLAQQTADFGGAQSSIRVRVHQMSARIGRGKPTEEILP